MYGDGFDDLIARADPAGTTEWYGTDLVGSVRRIFDNSGSVVASSDFDAFGNLIAGSLTDRYGYTGREWDAGIGLYFYRARPYDPTTGRFYAEDEMGFDAGDVNLYRYVGNKATTERDPSGLDYLKEDGDKVFVITEDDGILHTDKGNILVGRTQTTIDGRKVIVSIPGTGYDWSGMADYKTFEILTEKDAYRGTDQWDNQRTHDSILVQLQASANVVVQKPQQDKGILSDLGNTISAIQTYGAGGEHVVATANQNGIPLQAVLPEPKIEVVPPKGPPGTKFEPSFGKMAIGGAVGASVGSGTGFVGGMIGGIPFGPPGIIAFAIGGLLGGGFIGGVVGAYDSCFVPDVTQVGPTVAPSAALNGFVGGLTGPVIGKVLGYFFRIISPTLSRIFGFTPATGANTINRVITQPNEAVFWSGRTDGVGGANVAKGFAGKGGKTLEMLIEERGIKMPEWNPNNPSSIEAWNALSRELAAGASGEVRVVLGENLRPGNTWELIEFNELKANPNVTKITSIDPKTGMPTLLWERGK